MGNDTKDYAVWIGLFLQAIALFTTFIWGYAHISASVDALEKDEDREEKVWTETFERIRVLEKEGSAMKETVTHLNHQLMRIEKKLDDIIETLLKNHK